MVKLDKKILVKKNIYFNLFYEVLTGSINNNYIIGAY